SRRPAIPVGGDRTYHLLRDPNDARGQLYGLGLLLALVSRYLVGLNGQQNFSVSEAVGKSAGA
ncbi:MAG TPA: hypothetical protein V6D18_12385, partial [Thermosynechococcaceae cyanobacterium]